MTDSNLLTVREAAEQLRVPVAWLKAEARAGHVPCLRLSKTKMLFSVRAVEQALLERASGPDVSVSLRRAARVLGLREAFLRREVVHDRIPYFKDGARILLNPEAVRGALANRDSCKTDERNRAEAAST